jgi:DNA-binding protein HU-beta
VNRNELVDAVAGKADLSKTAASKAVEAVFESITGALKGGGEVRLVGFGTFSVARRAASEGRNPLKTGKVQAGAPTPGLAELGGGGEGPQTGSTPSQSWSGRLAQLAEHLVYTEGVGGSNPSSPTTVS